jgi:outer membrane murein-binding lipoprotein Lpp
MGRTGFDEWTDARLNQLAASLEPVPTRVAALSATVEHMDHVAAQLEPLPAQIAVLAAAVDRLAEENRALRSELAAVQLQLVQTAWGLVAALIAAGAALIAALL